MRFEQTQMTDGLGRATVAARPQRPWLLIAAALLLAVLSTVLWGKWKDSRTRADQLQAELKQVYAEAESLRTQANRAQQRITQLEKELRGSSPSDDAAKERGPARPKR